MGIFGKMDAETIPTNPFFVEEGEYTAEITKAAFKESARGRQLNIVYIIRYEGSAFNGSPITQFFNLVDSTMDEVSFSLLPADEQKKIRQTNSALKRTLCGTDGRDNQPGLGVSADDLNDENWNPEVLVGLKVDIAVYNYGPNKDQVGVRFVNVSQE